MKNKADHEALVVPLLERCGGSIEGIATRIKANMTGGLLDSDPSAARKAAFGENRLPEKPMVKKVQPSQLCALKAHLALSARIFFFTHLTMARAPGHILGTLP